jgi:hypothetical protein
MRISILLAVAFVVISGVFFLNFSGLISITGMITGTTSVSVGTSATVSLPVSTVAFGELNPGQFNDTTDNNPFPFVIQNDGNVNVNVTIGADNLWTTQTNPSTYFRFNSTENETGSVVSTATDLVAWTDMPTSPVNVVTRLKYPAANDAVNVHINITVPEEEGAGSKSSTVTFTASQA